MTISGSARRMLNQAPMRAGDRQRGRRAAAVALVALAAVLVQTAPAAAVTLSPGDIVVVDAAARNGEAWGAVFRIDPVTGERTTVSEGGFGSAYGVALEPDGNIVVADQSTPGTGYGSVVRVDLETGALTTVTSLLYDPVGIAVEPDGDILVADLAFHAIRNGGAVVRVDSVTGAVTPLTSRGSITSPTGIAVEPDGDILVANAGYSGGPGATPGAIIRVDAQTGAQTTVSSGGSFVHPSGVALERDGSILVADGGTGSNPGLVLPGALIRVDPETGAQTTVSVGGLLASPYKVEFEADGNVLVADPEARKVIRVDPATGAQTAVSSSAPLAYPLGVAVVPANRRPVCSAVTPSPGTLLRASHDQLKTIALGGASDPDADGLSFHIDSVHQDEPVSGTVGKKTSADAQLVNGTADTNQVRVRADADAKANGRVYRIAYTVSDETATCSGVAKVSVPAKKQHNAVDDGDTKRWDSFTAAQVFP